MAQEYYIRESDDDAARGPFNIDKLVSLAEADQVSPQTLFYDEDSEQWFSIASNDILKSQIFPEKKKLTLRPKSAEEMDLLNAEEDHLPSVSVNEMLAAAEGDTEETRYVKKKLKWQEKAASMAIPALGMIMLISAFNNIYPNSNLIFSEVIDNENPMILIQEPLIILGFFDLMFAIFLLLSVTEIYPLLRFRAMVGCGYLGFLHYAHWFNGDDNSLYLMASAIGGSLGVFVCTLTLRFSLMVIFAIIGMAGMIGYFYYTP